MPQHQLTIRLYWVYVCGCVVEVVEFLFEDVLRCVERLIIDAHTHTHRLSTFLLIYFG